MSPRRGQRGQATVELVLALPVVVLALLLVIQVGLIARDQVLVVDAARQAARAAAVEGPDAAAPAARATPGLHPDRIAVTTEDLGDDLQVEVRYRAPTDVPIAGLLVADPTLTATVVMRREEQAPGGGRHG